MKTPLAKEWDYSVYLWWINICECVFDEDTIKLKHDQIRKYNAETLANDFVYLSPISEEMEIWMRFVEQKMSSNAKRKYNSEIWAREKIKIISKEIEKNMELYFLVP